MAYVKMGVQEDDNLVLWVRWMKWEGWTTCWRRVTMRGGEMWECYKAAKESIKMKMEWTLNIEKDQERKLETKASKTKREKEGMRRAGIEPVGPQEPFIEKIANASVKINN